MLQQGRAQEAEALYQQLLCRDPRNAAVHCNLAALYGGIGRIAESIDHLRTAIMLRPDHPESHFNLGFALNAKGEPAAAIDSYNRALSLRPAFPEALLNIGDILRSHGEFRSAIDRYEKALAQRPDDVRALCSRGLALMEMGDLPGKIVAYAHAHSLRPEDAEILSDYGILLQKNGDLEAAIAALTQVVTLRPGEAQPYLHLGNSLRKAARLKEAISAYEQAIQRDPGCVEAHWNLALLLLLTGQHERGWQEYEWRWKGKNNGFHYMETDLPEWTPDRGSRRPLIWPEQGIGDQLMFGSLLGSLQAMTDQLTVCTDTRLLGLFRRSLPGIQVVDASYEPGVDEVDSHLPMGTLARHFFDSREASDSHDAFLQTDPVRCAELRQRLRRPGRSLIGLSWSSTNAAIGPDKSIPLDLLARTVHGSGADLLSLQYGPVQDTINAVAAAHGIEIRQESSVDAYSDLDGLASIITCCDLVISISNVTAHLAGAVGTPTWVLLPLLPDWRWGLSASTTSWYPSLRLFRQRQQGDWADVMEEVRAALGETLPPPP